MAIEEITAYQVRCDHPAHGTNEQFYEGAVTQDGLMTGEYDGPVWFESREQAIDDARGGWGWQVTTAGIFCVEHATDDVPLEQPGPTLLDLAPIALHPIDPNLYDANGPYDPTLCWYCGEPATMRLPFPLDSAYFVNVCEPCLSGPSAAQVAAALASTTDTQE